MAEEYHGMADMPRDELLEELQVLSVVTGRIDQSRGLANRIVDTAESDHRRRRVLARRYFVLGLAIPAAATGTVAMLGYDDARWFVIVALVIGGALLAMACSQYVQASRLLRARPQARQRADATRQTAEALEKEYGERLRRLPQAYRHPQALNFMYKYLAGNPGATFAQAADRYDLAVHEATLHDLRRQQIEQRQRQTTYEEQANTMRTVNLIEKQRLLGAQRETFGEAQRENTQLRSTIAAHGEDPSTI